MFSSVNHNKATLLAEDNNCDPCALCVHKALLFAQNSYLQHQRNFPKHIANFRANLSVNGREERNKPLPPQQDSGTHRVNPSSVNNQGVPTRSALDDLSELICCRIFLGMIRMSCFSHSETKETWGWRRGRSHPRAPPVCRSSV